MREMTDDDPQGLPARQADAAAATHAAQIEALRAVSAELTRELNIERLLPLVMTRAVALFGTTHGSLYLWEEATGQLVPHMWQGHGVWEKGLRFGLGQGVAGAVAQRREGLIVNDFRGSLFATPLVLAETTHAAVPGEPLLIGDRLLGVVTIDRRPAPLGRGPGGRAEPLRDSWCKGEGLPHERSSAADGVAIIPRCGVREVCNMKKRSEGA
jgi:transcriptional regulator with GAF, ATPase, and Fis domain